jgi:hypothetical protein
MRRAAHNLPAQFQALPDSIAKRGKLIGLAQDRQIVAAAQCLGINAAERRFLVARRRCPAAD